MAHPRTTFILLACAATLLGARVSAFQSGGNETLSVDADHLEIQDKVQRALAQGNVRARQGAMTVTSDRAEVLYSSSLMSSSGAPPEISQIRASGNVDRTGSAKDHGCFVDSRLVRAQRDERSASAHRFGIERRFLFLDTEIGQPADDAAGKSARADACQCGDQRPGSEDRPDTRYREAR